ncbi:hypothetical protein HPB48_007373 [Haemaphysalis longicornis]|uniref:Uncharacterized protein n=1 Tax=Haemaphysalis longicornis TaxID=44386 RepID=A0A9J6G446_HAELO|nr:hypothetical protein HPB48_007373 [Haemaphysalis longicornis]
MDDALGPTKPTSAESVPDTASATHQPSFLVRSGSSVLNDQHSLPPVQAKLSGRTSERASCLATMSTKSNNSPVNAPTSASSIEGIVTPESPVSELDGSAVLDSSDRGLHQILTSAIQPLETEFPTEGRKLCANSPAGSRQDSYLENTASRPQTPTVGDCNDNARIGEPHLSTEAKLPKDKGDEVQSSPGPGSRAEVFEKKTDELPLGGWGEKMGVDAITAFPVYGTRKEKRSDTRDGEGGREKRSAREKGNRERQMRHRSPEGDRGNKRRSGGKDKPQIEVLYDFRTQSSKGGEENSTTSFGAGLLGGLLTQRSCREGEEESREYTESDPPRKGRNTATRRDRPDLDYVHSVVDNLIKRFSTRAGFGEACAGNTIASFFPITKSINARQEIGIRQNYLESVTGEVTTEAKKLRELTEKSPALNGKKRLGNSTAVVKPSCGYLFKDCTAKGGKRAGSKTSSKAMKIVIRNHSAKFLKPAVSKIAVKSHDSRKMLRQSGGSNQQALQESGEVPVRVRRSLCGSVHELMASLEKKDDSDSNIYTNAARKTTKNISADGTVRTKDSKKAMEDSGNTSPRKKRNVHFVTNLIIHRRQSLADQTRDSEARAFPKEAWGEVLWRKRKEEARKKAPKKVLSLLGPKESMEDADTLSTEMAAVEWSGNENTDNTTAGRRATRLSGFRKAFAPGSAVRRSMSKSIRGKAESRATLLHDMSGGGSFDLEANEDLSQDSQYSQFYPYEHRYGIDEEERPYWKGTKSQGSLMVREGEYRTGSRTTSPAEAYTDYRKNRSQADLTSEWGQMVPSEEQVDNERPVLHARIVRRRSRLTPRERAHEEGGDVAEPIGRKGNVSPNVFQAGADKSGSLRRITSEVLLNSQAGASAGKRVPPPVRTLSERSVLIELDLPNKWSRHPLQNRPSINPFFASRPRPFRSTSGHEFQRRSHRRGKVEYRHSPMVSHTAMPAMLPVADQLGPYIQNQQPTMPPYGLCSPPPVTSSPPQHWSRPPQLSYPSLTAPGVPMECGLRFSQAGYIPHSRLPPAGANPPPPVLSVPNVPLPGMMPQKFSFSAGTKVFPPPDAQGAPIKAVSAGIIMYSNRTESWDATVNDGEVDAEEQPPWMSGPRFKNDAALSEERISCRRPLCSERVAGLLRSLNKGVHPCQNFYGHVCSFKRPSSGADMQQAQETEHKVVAFFKRIGSTDEDLPVAAISRRLWKDCVDLATLNRQGKAPLRALLKLAELGGWPFGAGHFDAATLPNVWKAAGKLQRLMALAPLIKVIALSDGTLWLTPGDPSGSVEVEDVLVAMMEAAQRNVSRLRDLAADVAELSHRLTGLREHQPSALDDHEPQGRDVLPEIFLESAMKGLRRNVSLVRADSGGLVAATVKIVSESSPQTVLNLLGYKLVRQVDLFTEAAVKADLNAGASNRESLCVRAVLEDALSNDAAEYVRYAALRNEVDFDLVRSVAAELKRTLGAKLAELRWMDTSTLKSAQSGLRNIKVRAPTVNRGCDAEAVTS